MKRSESIPAGAKKLLRALIVARGLGLETRCNEKLDVFVWAPMVGFIYGEHAVLDGHEALLFKWDQYVGVGVAIDRSVAGLHFRLRGDQRHTLCWFKGRHRDFVAEDILEDGETTQKLALIEELLKWYVKKYIPQQRQGVPQLNGRIWIYHICELYPGTGLNWSGSSAIAISKAIHTLLGIDDPTLILRLAYVIEWIYHGGAASGYGAVLIEEGSQGLYVYRLTPLGIKNREELTKIWRDSSEDPGRLSEQFSEVVKLALCKKGPLFSISDGQVIRELGENRISDKLKAMFCEKGHPLSEDASVSQSKNNEWLITNGSREYVIQDENGTLNIYEKETHFYIRPADQAASKVAPDIAKLFQKKEVALTLVYSGIPKSTAEAIKLTVEELRKQNRNVSDWRRSLIEPVERRGSVPSSEELSSKELSSEELFKLIDEIHGRLCEYIEDQNQSQIRIPTGLCIKMFDTIKETIKKGLESFGFKLTGGGAGGTVCIFTNPNDTKKIRRLLRPLIKSSNVMFIEGSLTSSSVGALKIGRWWPNVTSLLVGIMLVLTLTTLTAIAAASLLNVFIPRFWAGIIVAAIPLIITAGICLYRADARGYPGFLCLGLDPFFRFAGLNVLGKAITNGLTFTGLVSLIYLLIEVFKKSL